MTHRTSAPLLAVSMLVFWIAAGCSDLAPGVSKFRIRISSPADGAKVLTGNSLLFEASVKGGHSPYDVAWDFGGAAPSSTARNPGLVTLSTSGTFTVVCRAEDAYGNTDEASITIQVQEIVAEILSPTNGASIFEGGSADFQGNVVGGVPPFTYSWDFDGGPPNSTVEDPGPLTFATARDYTVTFTVTDGNSASDSATAVLHVDPPLSARTKQDIKNYWNTVKPTLTSVSYAQNPVLTVNNSAFEGVLNATLVNEGVAWVKFYRWLAGLPDNVTEDAVFRVRCQKGSHVLVMLEINGDPYSSPHDPPVPSGATPLYVSNIFGGPATMSGNTGGWLACQSSNIYRGWGGSAVTPAQSVDGYMDDIGNDATLGHRRWILHPRVTQTAFGAVWGSGVWASCMYIVERPSFTAPTPDFDYVAFPSQGFYPTQCFIRATALWSFSVNSSKYDLDGVTQVTVVRQSDSQSLSVTTAIKTPGMGITPTISFDPGEATKDETYQVTIHDIYDHNLSQRFDYGYTVTFFDLNE